MYVLPLISGALLGLVYFGGLWLTMRALPHARQPALMVMASYFGRMAAAVAVIIGMALAGGIRFILLSLGGFVAVKLLLAWRLGPTRGGFGIAREVEDGNQP